MGNTISSPGPFDLAANNQLAVYYGQHNEGMIFDGGLATYCQNTDAQIIPLAFVDRFVAQGNGYPGTNFANSCGDAVYEGPGYNGQNDPTQNHLLASCNAISSGIKTCQDLGKKVVLSLGGAMETYSLTSDDDATQMADFLWGAFGPLNSRWTDASQPRPFDVPATNDGTTETPALVNVIDGFDFDIEHITPGESEYYITMINALRAHFGEDETKQYLITGAPQCLWPDTNMADIITQAQFDILFIQAYNTPVCSAREWVNSNPNFGTTGVEQCSGLRENWNLLKEALIGTPSAAARLYIGLPASTLGSNNPQYYLQPSEVQDLVTAFKCDESFGGLMLWNAGLAAENNDYDHQVQEILLTQYFYWPPRICQAQLICPVPEPVPVCCTQFYTVFEGDNCESIAQSQEPTLTLSDFEALNPSLDPNFCVVIPGDQVCVAGTQGECTVTPPVTPPATGCCINTYTVVEGDDCFSIAEAQNSDMTYTDILTLNPQIVPTETDLCPIDVGEVLCLGKGECPAENPGLPTGTGTGIVSPTGGVFPPGGTGTPGGGSASPSGGVIGGGSGSGSGSHGGHGHGGHGNGGHLYNNGTFANGTHGHGHGHHTTTAPGVTETHTITQTNTYTITSCPPVVTNCPYGKVTSEVVTITTTYCPGNQGSGSGASPNNGGANAGSPMTTPAPVVVYNSLTVVPVPQQTAPIYPIGGNGNGTTMATATGTGAKPVVTAKPIVTNGAGMTKVAASFGALVALVGLMVAL